MRIRRLMLWTSKLSCLYDVLMRTTLTIEEELAAQIEELRRREGLSLKRVINSLLREGLRSHQRPPQAKRYRTRTRKLGLRPGFDPLKLNRVAIGPSSPHCFARRRAAPT